MGLMELLNPQTLYVKCCPYLNFLEEADPPKCETINRMESYAAGEVTLWGILPAHAECIVE